MKIAFFCHINFCQTIINKERRECGKSTVKGLEHPWFAQLFYNKNSDSKIFCGGILVSPWMVLTSTYCAKKGKFNIRSHNHSETWCLSSIFFTNDIILLFRDSIVFGFLLAFRHTGGRHRKEISYFL